MNEEKKDTAAAQPAPGKKPDENDSERAEISPERWDGYFTSSASDFVFEKSEKK